MSKHRGSRASFIAALDIGDSAVFEAMPGNGSRLMQQIGVTARRAKMRFRLELLLAVSIRAKEVSEIVKITRTK